MPSDGLWDGVCAPCRLQMSPQRPGIHRAHSSAESAWLSADLAQGLGMVDLLLVVHSLCDLMAQQLKASGCCQVELRKACFCGVVMLHDSAREWAENFHVLTSLYILLTSPAQPIC